MHSLVEDLNNLGDAHVKQSVEVVPLHVKQLESQAKNIYNKCKFLYYRNGLPVQTLLLS